MSSPASTGARSTLTSEGKRALDALATRFDVSTDDVQRLLEAVARGNGSMAQFDIPALGGHGQWMRGGMTMVGDMFNDGLKAKVSSLCAELASTLSAGGLFEEAARPGQPEEPRGGGAAMRDGTPSESREWWPGDLGRPSSSGGQNDMRYAYFPDTHRLAISEEGSVSLYDTREHQIHGVQQRQGSGSPSLTFMSQKGTFAVADLPRVPLSRVRV